MIQSFTRDTKPSYRSFVERDVVKYSSEMRDSKDSYIPNPSVPKTPDFDDPEITEELR